MEWRGAGQIINYLKVSLKYFHGRIRSEGRVAGGGDGHALGQEVSV